MKYPQFNSHLFCLLNCL